MGCANIKMSTVQVLPEENEEGIFDSIPEGAKDSCCFCSKGLKKCLICLPRL